LQCNQFYIGATPKTLNFQVDEIEHVENYFSINAEAGIDGY
jgi:hypothetical protein